MKRKVLLGENKRYRYIRWAITEYKGNPPVYGWATQASEFSIYDTNGDRIYYPDNATAIAFPYIDHPNSDIQGADKLVDNNEDSGKFYDPAAPPLIITIDLKSLFEIGYYGYYTANDDFNRDPTSWTVELSVDGVNYFVADTQRNVSIPGARCSLAGKWKLNI